MVEFSSDNLLHIPYNTTGTVLTEIQMEFSVKPATRDYSEGLLFYTLPVSSDRACLRLSNEELFWNFQVHSVNDNVETFI